MRTLLPVLLAAACAVESAPEPPDAVVPSDTTSPEEQTPDDGTGSDDDPDDEADTLVPMDSVSLLVRASLDLRGVRPSIEEVEAVEADPEAVDAMIDAFLVDPAFGDRVRSMFSPIYLTQQDSWSVDAGDFGLDDQPGFAESVGQEPLRILQRIAEEDLPYTEIVTGDWTMANETLAEIFPVDYPDGETGWQVAQYTDGRPAGGVLVTNGMWWRYLTNTSNANRGRANAISRILLCTDYLSKPITFERDVNLLDAAAVDDALRNNPGCAACHHTLDPLASYMWGFFYYDYYSAIEIAQYHPEREYMWEDQTGVEPGYYGSPGYGLAELGGRVAADPRLPQCIAEQVFEVLLQRDAELEDTEALTEHREVLLDNELVLRPLFRSVLSGPEYRAGPTDDSRAAPAKLLDTDQLASSVEDLTGYRFTYYGYDMLSTDTYGLRTLAGGVDGNLVTRRATEPMTTMVLVQERLAEAAAAYVVGNDRDIVRGQAEGEPRLFTEITFSETPRTDREAMAAQVQRLHLRIFADRVDAEGEEVEAALELWEAVYDLDADPEAAWAAVLSVLLRDPEFLVY